MPFIHSLRLIIFFTRIILIDGVSGGIFYVKCINFYNQFSLSLSLYYFFMKYNFNVRLSITRDRKPRSTLPVQGTTSADTSERDGRRRTVRRSGRSEKHPRSAEADVFIRRKICIRCSRSSIAKSRVRGGASRRFKEALCHYSRDPLFLSFLGSPWISWTSCPSFVAGKILRVYVFLLAHFIPVSRPLRFLPSHRRGVTPSCTTICDIFLIGVDIRIAIRVFLRVSAFQTYTS